MFSPLSEFLPNSVPSTLFCWCVWLGSLHCPCHFLPTNRFSIRVVSQYHPHPSFPSIASSFLLKTKRKKKNANFRILGVKSPLMTLIRSGLILMLSAPSQGHLSPLT